jgi:hypothetical protein
MSISFYAATTTDNYTAMACNVKHGAGCTSTEHFEMDAWMDIPGYDLCFECQGEQEDACPICSLTMNVSNNNAMLLIERLGVEFDYCGVIDPADLLGRSMVANVGLDDSGMKPTVDTLGGGATMIDCGLAPGYFTERFGALANLATYAMDHGFVIAWS